MHRSPDLLALLARTSAASVADGRPRHTDARRPIDDWRASPAGLHAEGALTAAMGQQGAERRDCLSRFLTHFTDDLAGFVGALLHFARAHPVWQPPLNDFTSLGQHGLHLIENSAFRLSLLAVDAVTETPPPRVVRFGGGEAMVCAASRNAELGFYRWQMSGEQCAALPRATLRRGDVLHADLTTNSLSIAYCPRPAALLRLQIHDGNATERHFCGRTGRALPQVLGTDLFRRHLALAALSVLGRSDHARDCLTAAQDCGDDALSWHYMRQALATDGVAAMPLLSKWAEGERPVLAPLARQTLAVLHTHYPTLAAA